MEKHSSMPNEGEPRSDSSERNVDTDAAPGTRKAIAEQALGSLGYRRVPEAEVIGAFNS